MGPRYDQDAAKKDWLTPSFTPDTHILIRNAGKASWIQVERPAGGIYLVQMGKAYITANHHIQTDEGWMTARQAADRGHGTPLSDHMYPKFYSLRLVAGGNIIINTSAAPDQAPTQIEATTMGYRFAPLAETPNTNSPTFPRQEAGPRESRAAQAKPSYCQAAQRQLKGMSGWPTLQSAPHPNGILG